MDSDKKNLEYYEHSARISKHNIRNIKHFSIFIWEIIINKFIKNKIIT